MKGRAWFNAYDVRKRDILEILSKLGGEARWKTLKVHLKELKWSPSTLKHVLDVMIKEDFIKREARLSEKGAEVWYRIREEGNNAIERAIWQDELHKRINEMSIRELRREVFRSRLISHILKFQEELNTEFDRKIRVAKSSLEGEELNRELDRINEEEIRLRRRILLAYKEKGITGASDKLEKFDQFVASQHRMEEELASASSEIERTKILMKQFRERESMQ